MTMIQASPLLRGALALDAAACAGMGVLLSLAAAPLSGLFALPPDLLRGAGLLLLPCAALLGWLSRRRELPRLAVLAVIGVNLIWIADSLLLLAGGWFMPSGLGIAFVLAQAGAVLAVTMAEAVGLGRSVRHGEPA
ncbi:MAG: hypothetical protein Q8S58_08935 [Bosea sp. (in: a-proteobacteria)]|uniref:hypothetical protein n=1 Tax=Bosea sp. (in: a-proteobacteria) TaxID=1871050 RepID=UPI002735A823|nr:hypothetical protein [Bosea sp. (in: a-proteobacteria)]MDP3255638.1 hypothetical protein [Bosea sp. (in: a-proteobacteria)]MDP3319243.1 hypothetical protein [Bosea sp. (in: a-proteobacteria)]